MQLALFGAYLALPFHVSYWTVKASFVFIICNDVVVEIKCDYCSATVNSILGHCRKMVMSEDGLIPLASKAVHKNGILS